MVDGYSYKTIVIKDDAELLDLITEELYKDYNKKNKIHVIMENMGLESNMIADDRTLRLIETYRYYNSNATPPAPFTHTIWFDTVSIIETWKPKGLF